MLMPLMYDSKGKGRSDRSLWRSLILLKVEKELAEKLKRLNKFNVEMIRELGILGLEVQVTTKGLIMANNAASNEALSNLEAKIDSLRNDFENFTLSIKKAHAVTLEKSDHRSIVSDEWGVSSKYNLIENSPESGRSADQDSVNILASTVCTLEPLEEGRIS